MSQETVLLVIGNWGNGKSATANTLLGYNAFHKNNNTTRVVTEPDVKTSLDQTITIVDGLCLWGKDPKDLEEDTFLDAQRAVSKCGSGFNAVLIVMKYGETYSEEEARVVAVAKKVFGRKIFEEFGVCVFTRGDDFKYAVEEGEEPCTTFPEWYNSRSGNLKQLVSECGRRCVLIDNRDKDPKEKNSLLKLVNHLSKNGAKRYNLNEFQKYHGRDISASVNKTKIEKTFRDELENIREKFNDNKNKTDLPKMLNDLRDLSTKISQSPIDQKIIENLISSAQKVTTNIKMQQDKCSAYKDKEIPTSRSDYSDRSPLGKDRTMPGFSDRSTFDKDRALSGLSSSSPFDKDKALPAFSNRSILDITSDSYRFFTDAFNQKTFVCDQDKAVIAERLINDFVRNSSFNKGAETERRYANMKSQVLELLQSSPYLYDFKSRLSSLEQKIRSQLGSQGSSIEKEIGDAMDSSDEITNTLPEKVQTSSDVKLLLLGRSGNGKSSTGNSLLGRHAFQISSNVVASKSIIAVDSQRFEQFTLSVVDGPSLDHTVSNTSTGLDEMLKSVKEALRLCDYSFSGLLVILKFGQRFTKQEKNAVALIKTILGKDVLRKYGLCVMTHGDSYDSEMEEEKIDFLKWCQSQTGEIAELLKECSYRCILIDNKTRDEETQIKQRNNVLDLIQSTGKYSEEEFVEAEKDFRELSIQCAMPQLEQANSLIMSKIREKLQQLEREFPNGERQYIAELESMKHALQEYIHNIESLGQSKKTEYLVQLVSSLQMQINSKLRLCQQTEELRLLEKERELVHKDVSIITLPTTVRQEERSTSYLFSRGLPSSAAPRALLTECNTTVSGNFNLSQHVIDLNAFIQETKIRWNRANSDELYFRLQHKEVLVSNIDSILDKAAKRGERTEASDNACARLMDMKEKLVCEIESEQIELGRPTFYKPSNSTGSVLSDFQIVYHQQGNRHTTAPFQQYQTNARTASPLDYAQHLQVEQPHPFMFSDTSSSKKDGKKIRWLQIKSFFKSIRKALNNFEF